MHNSLIPELYVSDFDKSLTFYKEILLFKIEYTRQNPKFAFLSYENSQIMIQQNNNDEVWLNGKLEYPYGRGINIQIRTDEIEKIISSLKSNNFPLKMELTECAYMENNIAHKRKEIMVMDPDGYLLRFSEKTR